MGNDNQGRTAASGKGTVLTGVGPRRHQLTKHHGLGNDFLVAVDPSRPLDGGDARSWCDRRLGIGADGLILATPIGDHRWQMVLWNADGSRAEISGNGIRCLGQAIATHQGLDHQVDQQILIETDAGTRTLTIMAGDNADSDEVLVRVSMGKAIEGPGPSDRWSDLGVAVRSQQGVDLGNPHLVAFVGELGDVDMAVIGPVIEADYPGGINVHLVDVKDEGHLALRVWERGAGVTQACGSGACAAAWAANAAGLAGKKVTVEMPGGTADVELTTDEIFLTGPAVRVAEVIISG